jgi:hypothetical protein
LPIWGKVSIFPETEKPLNPQFPGAILKDSLERGEEIIVTYNISNTKEEKDANRNITATMQPIHLVCVESKCFTLFAVSRNSTSPETLPYALIENDSISNCILTGTTFTPPKQIHTRITENNRLEALLITNQMTSILLFDIENRRLLSRTDVYAKEG